MKKEEFKNHNIICTNEKEVHECMSILKKMGFNVEEPRELEDNEVIVHYAIKFGCEDYVEGFICSNLVAKTYKNISFYNFKKEANNILKEEKNKVEDIEVASDGRIIKVNNWKSEKIIYSINQSCKIYEILRSDAWQNYIDCGLIFATKEARDKAVFKLKIENQLKNIAEKLNNGEEIDWEDDEQKKFYISYVSEYNILVDSDDTDEKHQGTIYCLSKNFLDEAKEEIGEGNLIKYFKEC